MKSSIRLAFAVLLLGGLACSTFSAPPPQRPQIQNPVGTVISSGLPELVGTIQAVNEEAEKTYGPEFIDRATLPLPNYVPAENTYKIGDEVRSGDLTWMVLGWVLVEEPFMPAPTLYVDMLMVNRGNATLYTGDNYTVKDSHGQDTFEVLYTTLAPGERIRTWLTFMLVEEQPALLVLEADPNYNLPAQRIVWDLGPGPCAADVPATLEGERPQAIHRMGEAVTLGNLSIQVTGVSQPPVDGQTPTRYKKVHVDLVFQNLGSQDIEIDPTYAAYLKDADGFGYSSYFAMDYNTLFPGGQLITTAEFEVPDTAQGLMYEFDGTYLGFGKIFIPLGL
ncbi:MAG: DUF4352 domain-containing protein [Chloroflexota bacterium]